MKTISHLSFLLFLLCYQAMAQKELVKINNRNLLERQLTIEPALGIHTNFGIDLLVTNLVQWNVNKRLSLASHSSYNINNITQRNFNYVETNYNYSLNQKFGIGRTFYSKRSSHSFFFMAGAKYTDYKETLVHPDFDKVSSAVSSFSPDYGMMYSLKKGVKNTFFSFRLYLPLYPWPIKGSDINYSESNMENIALEFGVGIKIK